MVRPAVAPRGRMMRGIETDGGPRPAPALVREEGLPVYPGAVGFGVTTPAGRGGAVIRVTTTEDGDWPGTLRYALQIAEGPRAVVFDVGGVFPLHSPLSVSQPYLSVYGQTAPYPGVILRGLLRLQTHDLFFQHLTLWGGQNEGQAFVPTDGACLDVAGAGGGSQSIVVDHCTLMWGWSTLLQTGSREHVLPSDLQGVDQMTVSNCLLAEPLLSPEENAHRGSMLQPFTYRTALLRNLFLNCERCAPAIHEGTTTVVANNLICNSGSASIHALPVPTVGPAMASIVGNVIRPGPNTAWEGAGVAIEAAHPESRFYVDDNEAQAPPWVVTPSVLTEEAPIWPEWMDLLPTRDVYEYVLSEAGARPWDREPAARRVIEQMLIGRGGYADQVEGYGGWPHYQPAYRELSLPEAEYEIEHDGYSRLEHWVWDGFGRPPTRGRDVSALHAALIAARDRVAALQRELEALVDQF